MSNYWQGKAAIVTGGSAGLGLAIAQALAAAGASVMIAARDPAKLQAAVDSLQTCGDIHGQVCDVSQQEQVDQLIAAALDRWGKIDLLVNNVGRSHRGRIVDVTPEQHAEFFETNFLTAVRCTKAALPALEKSQGHLVNIGSLAAKTASRFLGAYATSKFPLAAFSQQLRLELAETGVHVLLVCPGPIKRDDAGARYNEQAADLPDAAKQPGGGAKIKGLAPDKVALAILKACQRRTPELVMPGKARLLFTLSSWWPRLGDWVLRKMSG